jgi:DNA-binding NarL/FixJ family response regulator/HPt (histidine-containing phosphotransfer) domain-containing protein
MASHPTRILLVDDDPDDVWLMRDLLGQHWGGSIELVNATLLATATAYCAESSFDVILLDLSLPDSSGLETFLAMQPRAKDVPILVLTGYDDKPTAIRAVQAGAQDYLVKGRIDDQALVRSIRQAIQCREDRRAKQAQPGALDAPQTGQKNRAESAAPPDRAPVEESVFSGSEALRSVRGDRELLAAVVDAFLDESPQLVRALRQAINTGDAAALRLRAHTLKASLRYLGATEAFQYTRQLEMMGRETDLKEAESVFADLQAQMTQLWSALRQHRTEEPPSESS